MEKFVLDAEVAQLAARLEGTDGEERLGILLPLAWHLRERDTQRAMSLVYEAQALLSYTSLAQRERQSAVTRMRLITAETKWLFSELHEAQELARIALQSFEELHDFTGSSDAHWLLASIAADDHTIADADAELERCVADARRAGDQLRAGVALAFTAVRCSDRDPHHAKELWSKTFPVDTCTVHPGLATWVEKIPAGRRPS